MADAGGSVCGPGSLPCADAFAIPLRPPSVTDTTLVPPAIGELPPASDRKAAMPFIMLTVLIDMAAIGLIVPVLPSIVGSFTGSQSDQALW